MVTDHAPGRRAETMCRSDPQEEPVVKTTVLEDDPTAKRATERWPAGKDSTVGSVTWLWRTDRS